MAKVVHIETRIQSVFGILDDEGNIVEQFTVTARGQDEQGKPVADPLLLRKFTKEGFEQAYEALNNLKGEVEKKANTSS